MSTFIRPLLLLLPADIPANYLSSNNVNIYWAIAFAANGLQGFGGAGCNSWRGKQSSRGFVKW